MIIPQKIIVDTKLVVLECSDAVQLFWGLEKGMSLFDVFCEDICLAYQKYISAAEIASFSFSNKQVFALKEELIALDNDHYEIKITLPLSVYTALSAERIQFLNELPIAASIQNRSGEILYANQKSQAVYGRTEEIVGSGSGDARWRVQNQKGEDLSHGLLPTIRAIKENKPLQDEVIAVYNPQKKDRIWLQVNCTPLHFKGVIPAHAVQCVFTEITESVKLNYKYKRFLAEKDFIIKLSNGLLQNSNTDFHLQQQFVINEIGKHCQADAAFILDVTSLNKERPHIASFFKDEALSSLKKVIVDSFTFSPSTLESYWLEKANYKIDRISLEEDKNDHLAVLAENNIESLLYLPLIVGTEVIALIMLYRKINGRSFKENDQYLLNRVAELLYSLYRQSLASHRIKESEERYRALFYNSGMGKLILDDHHFIDCNKTAADLLEYSVEELIGKHPSEISPQFQHNGESSKKLSETQIAQVLKGEDQSFEWVHLSSQGKEVTVKVHLSTLSTTGKTTILVSWLDISQERRNEDQLLRLHTAVENSPVSMVITNTKAEIEYVNPAVLKITGYTSEELMGKNPRIFQSGNTPANHYREMWASLSSKKEWHGIFHNKRKNGEFYWERVHISPIIKANGKLTHYLAVKEDITLFKQYLEALEKQNNTFKEIAWTESHVLRAPLARLLGLLQFFQEKDFDAEMNEQKVLNLMEESALEMDAIINAISKKTYEQRLSQELLKENPFKF